MDLTYNVAFNSRSEITLAAGQRIILHRLYQWLTYSGWLEGRPWSEWNNRIVAASLRKAEEHCAAGASPVLLAPERRPYLREPSELESNREFYRHDPEWLPVVTCIGVFQGPIARDQSKHVGILTVVWFQPEYAPPIVEPYATQLCNLSWESVATDIEL